MTGAISLLGIPHDENSSYLRGPAEAPALIRRELHSDAHSSWSETGFDLTDRFLDHGDIDFAGAGDPWERIESEVGRALNAGHPLISLGGDHAIAWPVLRAVRRRHPSLTIVQIDAPPDIYPAYQGNLRSHTSSFARIMEERLADRLIQIGLRTLTADLRGQIRRSGTEVVAPPGPGEVIVEVGQEAVAAPADVTKRVEALKKEGRKSVLLLVASTSGDVRFVAIGLD